MLFVDENCFIELERSSCEGKQGEGKRQDKEQQKKNKIRRNEKEVGWRVDLLLLREGDERRSTR